MATANKEDLLLRSEISSPLTTKGSAFTFKNLDDNFITAYNQFLALSQSSNVDAYDNTLTYSPDDYVMYSNQMYKQTDSVDTTGIAPDVTASWTKVYASDLVQAPNGIRTFKKTITSAEVLQLNSTPIDLVVAPGADKAIQLLSGNATVLFDEGSPSGTPYSTNLNLLFGYDGGSKVAFTAEDILGTDIKQTMALVQYVDPSYAKSTDYILENAALILTTQTGNPTAGDSDVLIQGTYKIIDLN